MSLTVLVNAGPWLRVPPDGYGGIETVVATLVPELRRAGVRVVLAGVAGSELEVDRFVPTVDEPRLEHVAAPYNESAGIAHAHMQEVVTLLRDDPGIDLVHDHLEVVGPAVLAAMGSAAPPTLQTLHWDLGKHADFYARFDGRGRVGFAAVSQSQLDRAPRNLREQALGVVPLAVEPPPPGPQAPRGDHVLVLARVTAAKGQDVAVRVARAARVPLVLAGPVAGVSDPDELDRRLADPDDPLHRHPDAQFWQERVRPHVDGDRVRWVGGVSGACKERLLQSARAVLMPIRWAEPGATAVVEALSRGVPVVGTPLGVLPSLVQHGTTGYLAHAEDQLARHLLEADHLSPAACRAAAAPWTPRAMAERYLDLYDQLLRRNRAHEHHPGRDDRSGRGRAPSRRDAAVAGSSGPGGGGGRPGARGR